MKYLTTEEILDKVFKPQLADDKFKKFATIYKEINDNAVKKAIDFIERYVEANPNIYFDVDIGKKQEEILNKYHAPLKDLYKEYNVDPTYGLKKEDYIT